GVHLASVSGTNTTTTLVQGNLIGTDATGTVALPNGANGVLIINSNNNTIGGSLPSEGNTIAFNHSAGVGVGLNAMDTGAIGNVILMNSIVGNGRLGIDLGSDGVTPNTPSGPHPGPNHLQNFPVLASATSTGAGTTITGGLNSTSLQLFLLQFLANATA